MRTAQLAQLTPYPSSSQLHEALSRPRHDPTDATASTSGGIANTHGKTLTVIRKAQEAWIEAMCSKIARTDLLDMPTPASTSFEGATAQVLSRLRAHPEENKELIGLYEHLLSDIQALGMPLQINDAPGNEMSEQGKAHGHEHDHGNTWWGDPDEPVHGLIPFAHIFTPLFAGVDSLPAHYREQASSMLKNLSSYLANAGVSHQLGEKIFTMAIYAAVLPLSCSASKEGFADAMHGWSGLLAKHKERDEEKAVLATLHACSPALKETDIIKNRKMLMEARIASLEQEIGQAQSTLLLGLSAASTGIALAALSIMKFTAEACHSLEQHPEAVGVLGKAIPVAQTVAAVGAGVLGYALQKKSGTISTVVRQGKEALKNTFSRFLPQSVIGGSAPDVEEGVSETQRKYHDAMTAKSEKYGNFLRRFHGINSVFFASSIANALSNLVEDGLYIFSRSGNDTLHDKTINAVATVMESNDIASAAIGVGMSASSLQFFHGHPGLMKLESARFSKDQEIDTPFLLLHETMRPESSMELRAQLYKQLTECHQQAQLFIRKIELVTHSRNVAASMPALLRDKVATADIADFLIHILDIKADYLAHKHEATGHIFQKVADHHLLHDANDHDRQLLNGMIAESYRAYSKESVLRQQIALLKDDIERWKNDEGSIDPDTLASRLKAVLSSAIHDDKHAAGDEDGHHHHFTLPWAHHHVDEHAASFHDVVAGFLLNDNDRYQKQVRRMVMNHMYAATIANEANVAAGNADSGMPEGGRSGNAAAPATEAAPEKVH